MAFTHLFQFKLYYPNYAKLQNVWEADVFVVMFSFLRNVGATLANTYLKVFSSNIPEWLGLIWNCLAHLSSFRRRLHIGLKYYWIYLFRDTDNLTRFPQICWALTNVCLELQNFLEMSTFVSYCLPSNQ